MPLRLPILPVLALVLSVAPSYSQGTDRLPADISIRKALLTLAQRHDPETGLGPVRAQLSVFELELEEHLEGKRGGAARARAISEYFFKEFGFESHSDLSDANNFYVNRVVDGRRGFCLSLSAIIVATCRRLKLPVYGVAAPRHFFVRWDDGKTRYNIETTESGRRRPDTFYRKLGVTPKAEKDGVYLRNLTDGEVVAYLLNNEGFIHWSAKKPELADARFSEALDRHPRLVEAWINRGVVAGDRGDEAAASGFFAKALAWLPDDGPLHYNRALAAVRAGDYEKALTTMEEATVGRRDGAFRAYMQLLRATLLRPEHWRKFQREVVKTIPRRMLQPGLNARYFSDVKLEREGLKRVDSRIDFEWRWGSPGRRIPDDNFSARWEGWLEIPADDEYTVFTLADGGVRLWLDGVRFVDDWRPRKGALTQETMFLAKGLHRFKLEFGSWTGPAGVIFKLKRASARREMAAKFKR